MAARPKVPKRSGMSQYTDDPEMLAMDNSSTLGKQAAPLKAKVSDKDYQDAQWARVDKARAIKGKPSLPKPGTKAWRS